ncbi:Gfo/Idh/MocA family oxidoreductase [Leifsonia shinshuensis]|uniref:Gfo/Idh/MocA family protein n=1 Tax=Leifsonia shinshuensis TaxID=150026 RepID=UPI0028548DFD|nr:Gfo/Idh/MocA family oxidoreductase [Leifsonia shinshuensis]MDR6971659.1 putative dehydrogenase [Leifsonia shinshuensis]
MKNTSVRPVIIGSGMIAVSHARALADIGIAPAVVWSPSPANRERFAADWDAVSAPSLTQALDTPGVTHVHVCSTPMNHLDPIREAAERGLAIVSEKPLAPTGELASEALEYVQSHDVAHFLNFNRRQDEGIQLLRAAIGAGDLGAPVSVFGHYRQQWNANPSGLDWRYDPQQVGPSRTVTEIGSHWLDLAEFVLGDHIGEASGLLSRMGERDYDTGSASGRVNPPNDDLFAALLRFDSGVVGQVYGTELSHGSFDEIELRVDGTLGSAVWTSGHPNLLRIGDKTSGLRTLGLDAPTSSLGRSIAAIYGGEAEERGVATFVDGLSNALAMDAIRLSAQTNTWKETR